MFLRLGFPQTPSGLFRAIKGLSGCSGFRSTNLVWCSTERCVWHGTKTCSSIADWHPIIPVQAIIFLAPLTFNLALDEDPTVNRIEDSIAIWKTICSNKLLERAAIILFLNKMDVLAATLKNGVRVRDYVLSYGDLPNDVSSVSKCMSFLLCLKSDGRPLSLQTSGKSSGHTTYVYPFQTGYSLNKPAQKKLSPRPRAFFWHETSVIVRRFDACFPLLISHPDYRTPTRRVLYFLAFARVSSVTNSQKQI